MFVEQGGCCKICRKPPKKNRLAVDHDHETKIVRGLLCLRCNYALGGFDSLLLAERVVEYLRGV